MDNDCMILKVRFFFFISFFLPFFSLSLCIAGNGDGNEFFSSFSFVLSFFFMLPFASNAVFEFRAYWNSLNSKPLWFFFSFHSFDVFFQWCEWRNAKIASTLWLYKLLSLVYFALHHHLQLFSSHREINGCRELNPELNRYIPNFFFVGTKHQYSQQLFWQTLFLSLKKTITSETAEGNLTSTKMTMSK